ncbi:MAG: class F sortase [Dehalococcoidia bacterium]
MPRPAAVSDGGYNRVMQGRRAGRLDGRDIVLGVAIVVFLSSVSGLVATAVAKGHELPGYALYSAVVERRHAASAAPVLPPEIETDERPQLFAAPVLSISIPAINIVAPLVPMGVRPDNYMDLPNSPHDVAWYQFTSKPGMGGNAVFSAHVDYINYGPAVFWNLGKLQAGDTIMVRLRDGALINYVVSSTSKLPVEQLDVAAEIAPTTQESITLITCSGEFALGNYSHRVVVRAVRASAQPGS